MAKERFPKLRERGKYGREAAKLEQLLERQRQLDAEREQMTARWHTLKLSEAAERLLDGEGDTDDAPPTPAEFQANASERRLLAEAIRIQRSRTRDARSEDSQALCAELLPRYKAILRKMAERAVALAEAADEERRFVAALQADHVDLTELRPLGLDDFRLDAQCRMNAWLDLLERHHEIIVNVPRRREV